MADDIKKFETAERAKRLVEARARSGLGSQADVCARFGWNLNNYKAHESGRNGFHSIDGKAYAKAYNISFPWLYLGLGTIDDKYVEDRSITHVPFLTWVSAGRLASDISIDSFDDLKMIPAMDLGPGDWIALRVEGDSMNKISPPDSMIFVNRRDKHLVPNACYVVYDEAGNATYKRYRPNDMPQFQPASYRDDIKAPDFDGAVNVLGRVRRSVIEM